MGNEFPGSPYVIQEFSATVRGQAKLKGEGKPQGGNRQAPEPPDMPGWAWSRKVRERMQAMACGAKGWCLHFSTFTSDQCIGRLVTQDGPQDADGFAGGCHASDAGMLGDLQAFAVANERRLV
jgi:hypothetical protein